MILEQCDGAEGIADDVVVYGATEDEHDKNLHQLMNVAMRNGLVFNSSKCLIKERSVSLVSLASSTALTASNMSRTGSAIFKTYHHPETRKSFSSF